MKTPDIGIQVGQINVTYFRDRQDNPRYEPDTDGHKSFVIPAFDCGDLIDLVAWRCDDPRWFASREGEIFALGQDTIDDPGRHFLERPLSVHRTPEKWLRNGQAGICIIRPSLAHAWLERVPSIQAEDLKHAEYLNRLIQPPKPENQILIPQNTICEVAA